MHGSHFLRPTCGMKFDIAKEKTEKIDCKRITQLEGEQLITAICDAELKLCRRIWQEASHHALCV
jgi:hypothetical protein